MNPGDRVAKDRAQVDQPAHVTWVTEANDPHTAAECLAHCSSRMAPNDYDMAVVMIEIYATLQRGKQIEEDLHAWQAIIDRTFGGALANAHHRPISADEVEGRAHESPPDY